MLKYLKKTLGIIIRTRFPISKVLLVISLYFLIRILYRACSTIRFVQEHESLVSSKSLLNSEEFQILIDRLKKLEKPPAIFMLNRYAIQMTNNFLCNTKDMKGVHQRILLVTVDPVAKDKLEETWPNILKFHWPVHLLQDPFSQFTNQGSYHLFYLFRANLALALVKSGQDFWMLQQDTFWRSNLFELGVENGKFDLLFDRNGHDFEGNNRKQFVDGANWFVRSSPNSEKFFAKFVSRIKSLYTTDSAILTMQCAAKDKEFANISCSFIPYKILSSWTWLAGGQSAPPHLLQIDDAPANSKIEAMKERGFYFIKSSHSFACNSTAVIEAKRRVINGKVELKLKALSLSGVIGKFGDLLLSMPIIGDFVRKYGLLGHYFYVFWM